MRHKLHIKPNNNVVCNNCQIIIDALKQKENVLIVNVSHFSVLLEELGFLGYQNIVSLLQSKITNEFKCNFVRITHNVFCVISVFNFCDMESVVNGVLHQLIIEQNIYLSIQCKHFVTGEAWDNPEELQYNILAQSEASAIMKWKKASQLYKMLFTDSIYLALQPLVNQTMELLSCECLLRTKCDKLLSTSRIVQIAEENNFITTLDTQVLSMVSGLINKNPNMILNVNISHKSIEDNYYSHKLINFIKTNGIASNLIIEITETARINNYTQVIKFINELHSLGSKIALDDFGSGYTSFVQLQSLKIDFVKIDGLFVKNVLHDKASNLFVKMTIDFAHMLGIKVVAECVENHKVAEELIELGVDYMQGYYFGKPSDNIEKKSLINNNRREPAILKSVPKRLSLL